jgi:hypothetical protein
MISNAACSRGIVARQVRHAAAELRVSKIIVWALAPSNAAPQPGITPYDTMYMPPTLMP